MPLIVKIELQKTGQRLAPTKGLPKKRLDRTEVSPWKGIKAQRAGLGKEEGNSWGRNLGARTWVQWGKDSRKKGGL